MYDPERCQDPLGDDATIGPGPETIHHGFEPARSRASPHQEEDRELLRRLLTIHEQERKLIAFEIHDGLCQQLTGAILCFQSYLQRDPPESEESKKMFDKGLRLLAGTIAEARRLIRGLRPPILDECGVIAALEGLIDERRERGGPEIVFETAVQFERLAAPLENAIFRIVQECLTNAARYSQSPKVCVRLVQQGQTLRIDVQDWGVGFDPQSVDSSHFGLIGIRERARIVGGVAVVRSVRGKGTRVLVELPLLEQRASAPSPLRGGSL